MRSVCLFGCLFVFVLAYFLLQAETVGAFIDLFCRPAKGFGICVDGWGPNFQLKTVGRVVPANSKSTIKMTS